MNKRYLILEALAALAAKARGEISSEALKLAKEVHDNGLAAVHAKQKVKALPATNSIVQFFQCKRCVADLAQFGGRITGESPETYARQSVGFTKEGLQVWCNRHDVNIAHIHFEGQTHPANLLAADTERMLEGGPKRPARRPKAQGAKPGDRVLVMIGDKYLDGYGGDKQYDVTDSRREAWEMSRADAEQRLKAWKLKGAKIVEAS